jgi:hypothetical protein
MLDSKSFIKIYIKIVTLMEGKIYKYNQIAGITKEKWLLLKAYHIFKI